MDVSESKVALVLRQCLHDMSLYRQIEKEHGYPRCQHRRVNIHPRRKKNLLNVKGCHLTQNVISHRIML